MSSTDSPEIKEAKEAEETNLDPNVLNSFQNEIISQFESPEEYLLYYSRIGDVDKLKKLFDLLDREKTTVDINVKGKNNKESKF